MIRLRSIAIALALSGSAAAEDTEIAITGDSQVRVRNLMLTLGGRLDHIRLQPASRSRASDAAFLIEQAYQEAGYNNVTVYWKIQGPRSISLRVDKGRRDLLGEVTIEGVPNPKLNEALADLVALTPRKRATGFKGVPFREEDLETAMQLMITQMHSIGFYDAEFKLVSRQRNPETGHIDLTYRLTNAGRILRIARPVFDGETPPGIEAAIAPYIGEPATTENLNALRGAVGEACSKAGFIRAKVGMTLDREPRQLVPKFTITRGEQLVLRDIRYTGQQKTDVSRIDTRIKDLKGQVIDGSVARERIGEILGTGAFSSIRVDLIPAGNQTVDALLQIEEGKARGVSVHTGYDTFEGAIFGAGYYDRNLFGQIRNLSTGFEITQRSLLGEVSLSDPWIAGSDYSGTIRIFARNRDNEGYLIFRSGLDATLSREITDHWSMDLTAGWAINQTTADGLPLNTLGDLDFHNPFITFTQTIDYRDNPVMPTTGWHVATPFEIGAALGDTNSIFYTKLGFESSYHRPIGSSGRLSLGLRGDLLIPSDDSVQLPIDLRLFNGGSRSVRSFRERELGPWSRTGYPVGGQASWVANVEYSRELAGPLRAVAFVDAGGLSKDWEDFALSDPEVAIGLGLRLDLPVGPVRFEYGHNLLRDGHDPSGTFHFAIGATF